MSRNSGHQSLSASLHSRLYTAINSDSVTETAAILEEMKKQDISPPDHSHLWAAAHNSDNVKAYLEASAEYNHSGLRPVSTALGEVMSDPVTLLADFASDLMKKRSTSNGQPIPEAQEAGAEDNLPSHGLPKNLRGSGITEIS